MEIIGYDRKNYEHFRQCVSLALAKLQSEGMKIYAGKWSKQSPYQKKRYKPNFVFPEVWVYSGDRSPMVVGGKVCKPLGVLINGEDVWGDYKDVVKKIKEQI